LINDTSLFGLTTAEYDHVLREYYVQQATLAALKDAVADVNSGSFSCFSLLLFSHGAQDGAFGQETISQQVCTDCFTVKVLTVHRCGVLLVAYKSPLSFSPAYALRQYSFVALLRPTKI
jgi:hypothetical protein